MIIIKEILFYISLICGTVILISLLIAGSIRSLIILLDHLKVGDTIRKALQVYIKSKRPDLKIESKDVVLKKVERRRGCH